MSIPKAERDPEFSSIIPEAHFKIPFTGEPQEYQFPDIVDRSNIASLICQSFAFSGGSRSSHVSYLEYIHQQTGFNYKMALYHLKQLGNVFSEPEWRLMQGPFEKVDAHTEMRKVAKMEIPKENETTSALPPLSPEKFQEIVLRSLDQLHEDIEIGELRLAVSPEEMRGLSYVDFLKLLKKRTRQFLSGYHSGEFA